MQLRETPATHQTENVQARLWSCAFVVRLVRTPTDPNGLHNTSQKTHINGSSRWHVGGGVFHLHKQAGSSFRPDRNVRETDANARRRRVRSHLIQAALWVPTIVCLWSNKIGTRPPQTVGLCRMQPGPATTAKCRRHSPCRESRQCHITCGRHYHLRNRHRRSIQVEQRHNRSENNTASLYLQNTAQAADDSWHQTAHGHNGPTITTPTIPEIEHSGLTSQHDDEDSEPTLFWVEGQVQGCQDVK